MPSARFLGGPKDGEFLWLSEELLRSIGDPPVLNFHVYLYVPLQELLASGDLQARRQVLSYYGTRASALAPGLSPDLYYFTPARDSIQIVRAQVPATDLQVYRWDTLRHSLDHYIQQHGWTPIWDTYRAERIDRWEHVLGEVAAHRS